MVHSSSTLPATEKEIHADIRAPRSGPRHTYAVTAAVVATLLLLPLAIFPFGNDQALYFLGGAKILQGAAHYREILDLKPPLIYHIYALAIALFGHGTYAIRIFDILVQGITAWMMISVVRRASGDAIWAATAGIFYAVLYVGQGYACTATAESFSGIFSIGMLWLLLNRRTAPGFLLVGILAGLLFLLKYTLGIVLLGVVLGEWLCFPGDLRTKLRRAAWMIGGFTLMAGLFAIYLAATGAVHDFLLMNHFIAGYSRIQWKSPSLGLKNMLRLVPMRFTDNYSMLFFFTTMIGLGATVRGNGTDHPEGDPESHGLTLLRLCGIELFLLLLTVILEGKYSTFQFSRLYPFAMPVAAYGAVRSLPRLRIVRPMDGYSRLVIAITAIVLLIFSPLNRYIWHTRAAVMALRHGAAELDAYYDQQGRGYSLGEIARLGAFLDSARRRGDRIFIASREAPMVYLAAREIPAYRILHSAFIVAPFAPQEWRDSTRSYLLGRRPAFIVLQRGDTMPDVTDSYGTSAETIHRMPGIDGMLQGEYTLTLRTHAYDVFERRRNCIAR